MIRIGFVQDFARSNEQDRQVAIIELEDWIGRGRFEIVWHGDERAMAGMPEVDLLLVDYGGLHHAYGDALQRYGHSVRRWADEHPGRLVVLWTAFTSACYRSVFEDFAPEEGQRDRPLLGRVGLQGRARLREPAAIVAGEPRLDREGSPAVKCPWCGTGLSSKYRVAGVVHPRKRSRPMRRLGWMAATCWRNPLDDPSGP